MDIGKHFISNQKRLARLDDDDWRVALDKCRDHLMFRLRQKTLSGVYSAANLGADPVDHYLSFAYEKILSGDWEWKKGRTLAEQMVRVVDSELSKEVDRKETGASHLSKQYYPGDDSLDFYPVTKEDSRQLDQTVNRVKLAAIEKACEGDEQLEFIVEALKEGKKRVEIAELLDLSPRQFDKLREKIIRRVKSTEE